MECGPEQYGHACGHVYEYGCGQAWVCANMTIWILYRHVYLCVYVCVCARPCVCVCVCVRACVNACVRVYVCTWICAEIYILRRKQISHEDGHQALECMANRTSLVSQRRALAWPTTKPGKPQSISLANHRVLAWQTTKYWFGAGGELSLGGTPFW